GNIGCRRLGVEKVLQVAPLVCHRRIQRVVNQNGQIKPLSVPPIGNLCTLLVLEELHIISTYCGWVDILLGDRRHCECDTLGLRGGNRWRQRQRSEEHTSELQSRFDLVCRLLLEKKNHRDESEKL